MKTIADHWARFEMSVIPPTAPAIQRMEMRRAFFAGFQSALVAGLQMAEESGPDDALGAAMLQALHDECKRFAADIAAGKA